VQVYEGYKGIITAFEHYKQKLKKGEEYLTFGSAKQELHYTSYWQRHHVERAKEKIHARMIFDQNTEKETIENRNSYFCRARRHGNGSGDRQPEDSKHDERYLRRLLETNEKV
jgi:hypothetical protein